MDAKTLRCPHCGAPTEPGAARCRYCKNRLAAVNCPQCFALIYDDALFCPHCGARRARVEGTGSASRCPNCRGRLLYVGVGDAALLECGACDAVWIDAGEFERICADTAARAAVLHRWASKRPAEERAFRYRPCVRCGKMMNRVNFARVSGIVVDVCREHGTFLDAGELNAVVTFIEEGGLDKARAHDIQELREERRRLEQAQQAARRAAARLGDTSHGDGGSLGTLWLSLFRD